MKLPPKRIIVLVVAIVAFASIFYLQTRITHTEARVQPNSGGKDPNTRQLDRRPAVAAGPSPREDPNEDIDTSKDKPEVGATLTVKAITTSVKPLAAVGSTKARAETKTVTTAMPASREPYCSVNPASYYEGHRKFIPECPTRDIAVAEDPTLAFPSKWFVLSLPTKMAEFHARRDFLQTFGFTLERWPATNGSAVFNSSEYGTMKDPKTGNTIRTWRDPRRGVLTVEGQNNGFLTLGERGYLTSMKKLFEHALASPDIHSVLVMDEDAVFDCDFKKQLMETLRSPRCGSPVARNSTQGGILILGSAIWVTSYKNRPPYRGWSLSNMDLQNIQKQLGEPPRCFNAHSRTYGSFAVMYHRDVFPSILQWLKTATAPFDHIFPYLSQRGHPVRVAYPFLAIQDVRHESTIDNRGDHQSDLKERAKIHKWQLDRYCTPDFTSMMSRVD